MDREERLRRALRDHIDATGTSASAWCRRAGLSSDWLAAFLRNNSHDIGSTRLIALADAAGVSIDTLLNRDAYDRMSAIAAAAPVLEHRGVTATLGEIARETQIPIRDLIGQFENRDNLLVEAWLHLVRESAIPAMRAVNGECLTSRMDAYAGTVIGWMMPRLPFYIAFRAAITKGTHAQRESYRQVQQVIADAITDRVLRPSRELLPLDEETLRRTALVIYRELASVLVSCGLDEDEEFLVQDFLKSARAILSGKTLRP
ncbi:hypothetical protein H2509_20655 [Stappia sp. F7233]|uniref:Uncharacterized protein n=1 Tax=Stappia albiluteola TaxID=2758565 RepID=A0A839AMA0_9HYPH|nr:hypothetical protein [Stappia albiluteola]MBA5779549.1 hypothetical protein [Stappia albiluteola]